MKTTLTPSSLAVRLLSLSALITLLSGALWPAPLAAKTKCFPREGSCVLVTVNGQPAVKLTKKDRRQLQPYAGRPYVSDVATWIPLPIQGELEIRADVAPGGADWFGAGVSADAAIVPLEEVSLDTSRTIGTAPSVRIGGEAVLTERLELQSNRLPAGPYLLRITLRGADNWDRATLFFRVTE